MSFRFRKSISPIPGVRVTLSPRGITTSIGVGPLRLTGGRSGPAITGRIPGSGLSYRQRLTATKRAKPSRQQKSALQKGDAGVHVGALNFDDQPASDSYAEPMTVISSENTSVLTTPGLRALLTLMEQSLQQKKELTQQHQQALMRSQALQKKINGWFYRLVVKPFRRTTFDIRQAQVREAQAQVAELQRLLEQSSLEVDVEAPDDVMSAFREMRDAFEALTNVAKIQDVTGMRETDQVTERTIASRRLRRKAVTFGLSECPIMQSSQTVPHLENANGGDIYIYPNFIVYFLSEDDFALLEIEDLSLHVVPDEHVEEDTVPADATVIRETWHKANRDGSRDRRFVQNYTIPVVLYGKLTLQSASGLNEEYQISDLQAAMDFYAAWQVFLKRVRDVAQPKE